MGCILWWFLSITHRHHEQLCIYHFREDFSYFECSYFFLQESKARGSGSDRRIHSPSGVQELVPSSCEFEISPFVQGKRVFKRDPIAAFSEFWAQKLLFVSSVKLIQLCMSWVCNGTWCRFDWIPEDEITALLLLDQNLWSESLSKIRFSHRCCYLICNTLFFCHEVLSCTLRCLEAGPSLKYCLSSGVVCVDSSGTCCKYSVTPGSIKSAWFKSSSQS